MSSQSLTLYLLNKKGLATLKAVLASPARDGIASVVLSRDPGTAEDCFEEMRELCEHSNVPWRERGPSFVPTSRFAIAVGWRWMIHLQETQLIVLHDSLLPRFRGFAPLVTALIQGETELGVTALYASEKYDQGAIIKQARVSIGYPLKIADAIELISPLYASLVLNITQAICEGKELPGSPQQEELATYSLWRDEDDYRIDWRMSAARIRRFVDAVGFPYSGASTMMDDEVVRILDCQELPDIKIEERMPGKVIWMEEGAPVIVCGEGLLKLNRLVRARDNALIEKLPRFRMRFR